MPYKTPEHKLAWTRDWRRRNPEKVKAGTAKWRKANKRYLQDYDFRRNYGIGIDERDAMLARQGGCCACCGTKSPGSRRGWVVDHDHITGVVRGIVCVPCNVKLGMLGDSAPAIVEETIRFLKYLRAEEYLPILEGRVRHALEQAPAAAR